MRSFALPATLLIVGALLSGCASAEPVAEEKPTPAATSSKPKPEKTPYVEPAYTFRLECSTASGASFKFDSFTESQSFQTENSLTFNSCNAIEGQYGTLTDVEQQAVRAAGTNFAGIETLHALCAQGVTYFTSGLELSAAQIAEATGMLTLCPNHPQSAGIQTAMGTSVAIDAERAAGLRFGDGLHKVGIDIQPGTYAIERQVEDCYWERSSRTGDILDNDFLTAAARVQVTIQPSDFTFYSQRCGEWTRLP